MEEKVKVVIELDKNTVQAAAYLVGMPFSDELWKQMVSKPANFSAEVMTKQKKEIELAMAMVAIGVYLTRMEETK